MESKRTCPECHLAFDAPLPPDGMLICPLCNSTFSLFPMALPTPAVVSSPRPDLSGRQVLRGVGAVAALIFVGGGLVYAYHLIDNLGHKPAARSKATASVPPASAPPLPIEVVPSPPSPAEMTQRPKPTSRPPELHPIAVPQEPQRPLTLTERVNRAIDRGVTFLRQNRNEYTEYRPYTALLGLTLLECGVPADDPTVLQLAVWVRAQQRSLSQTYELTLAILFLDRLGDPRDEPLIRNFGQLLLAGQLDCGTWTYSCLINEKPRGRQNIPSGIPNIPPLPSWPNSSPRRNRPLWQRLVYRGDNSNTQFAILGLWVAQRHGVSSRMALLTTDQYFRDTQHEDGSWAYHPMTKNWRDSMTCAGLMSLAMRYGVPGGRGRDIRPQHRQRVNDFAVQQGLRYLAQSLDKISLVGDSIVGVEAREPFYFLWSLERMAVIYDLKNIGKREWYPWAAEMLVDSQNRVGCWRNVIDTCFALLILKRSNFAQDLQLAVEEPHARPLREITGPIILQGPAALQGLSGKPAHPPVMPGTAGGASSPPALGPSITRTPGNK
jgi:hypothetical protein